MDINLSTMILTIFREERSSSFSDDVQISSIKNRSDKLASFLGSNFMNIDLYINVPIVEH